MLVLDTSVIKREVLEVLEESTWLQDFIDNKKKLIVVVNASKGGWSLDDYEETKQKEEQHFEQVMNFLEESFTKVLKAKGFKSANAKTTASTITNSVVKNIDPSEEQLKQNFFFFYVYLKNQKVTSESRLPYAVKVLKSVFKEHTHTQNLLHRSLQKLFVPIAQDLTKAIETNDLTKEELEIIEKWIETALKKWSAKRIKDEYSITNQKWCVNANERFKRVREKLNKAVENCSVERFDQKLEEIAKNRYQKNPEKKQLYIIRGLLNNDGIFKRYSIENMLLMPIFDEYAASLKYLTNVFSCEDMFAKDGDERLGKIIFNFVKDKMFGFLAVPEECTGRVAVIMDIERHILMRQVARKIQLSFNFEEKFLGHKKKTLNNILREMVKKKSS